MSLLVFKATGESIHKTENSVLSASYVSNCFSFFISELQNVKTKFGVEVIVTVAGDGEWM